MTSKGEIQIENKEAMKKGCLASPDNWDARALAFAKLSGAGLGVLEYYRQEAEAKARGAAKAAVAPAMVRLRAPGGCGTVCTMSGCVMHAGADGTVEVSPEEAAALERIGWQCLEAAAVV